MAFFIFTIMSVYVHDKVVPFKGSEAAKKQQVEEMFNNIAFRYDFLNRFLSAGIDISWRRKAISMLIPQKPDNILDIATGTGDMAIMAYKMLKPQKVTGIDISEGMLSIGKSKIKKLGLSENIELIKGDSETISFDDNTFDAATVAFGVRNFEDLEKGLGEIHRVLKEGAMLVVLEFSRPCKGWVKPFYKFYMSIILPLFGGLFSKDKKAYSYLNESVSKFPEGDQFLKVLTKIGFKQVLNKKLSLGICSIYCGTK